MNNVISLSGGKDSTAMGEMMLERGEKIHSAVFFDTGWEFPEMYPHIDMFEQRTGIEVVRLVADRSFDYWLSQHPIKAKSQKRKMVGMLSEPKRDEFSDYDEFVEEHELWEIDPYKYDLIAEKGETYLTGCGWPSPLRRWCTREKIKTIQKYMQTIDNPISCIGFADDEQKRVGSVSAERRKYQKRYPLIEYGITEDDALKYCLKLGYTWGGLYSHFTRVSCFCCPLQKIGDLRTIRKHYPELWDRMLSMDRTSFRGFRGNHSVHDLERRFAEDDRQMELF